MGYCTRFYMTAEDRSGAVRKNLGGEFINGLGLCKDFGFDADDELWTPCTRGSFALCDGEGLKWYDFDDEMRRVSVQHPHVLFTLDGKGEETGDIWRHFYLAGACFMWTPDVEPPEFDDFVKDETG